MPRGIHPRSKEWKKHMSERMKKNNPVKRLEVREKISRTLMGNKHSEESKRKISLAGKGRKHSEKTKKKLSEIKKGKPQPWNQKENHHNWQGGISFQPYSVDWTNTLKRSIRDRISGKDKRRKRTKITRDNKKHSKYRKIPNNNSKRKRS